MVRKVRMILSYGICTEDVEVIRGLRTENRRQFSYRWLRRRMNDCLPLRGRRPTGAEGAPYPRRKAPQDDCPLSSVFSPPNPTALTTPSGFACHPSRGGESTHSPLLEGCPAGAGWSRPSRSATPLGKRDAKSLPLRGRWRKAPQDDCLLSSVFCPPNPESVLR
jgi:hypothetical protein